MLAFQFLVKALCFEISRMERGGSPLHFLGPKGPQTRCQSRLADQEKIASSDGVCLQAVKFLLHDYEHRFYPEIVCKTYGMYP